MRSIEQDVVDNPRAKVEGRVYSRCSRCGDPCENVDIHLPTLCCRHFPDDKQCQICSKYPRGVAFPTAFPMHEKCVGFSFHERSMSSDPCNGF